MEYQAVGMDVSKATLDVSLWRASGCLNKRVANQPAALPALLAWMQEQTSLPLHVCLEPTGTYHDEVVAFLLSQAITVSLVPPSQIAAFRRSEGSRRKTDKQDAMLLARYCQQKQPAALVPVPADLQELRQLLSRLDQLEHMRQQERNRLENGRLSQEIQQQIAEHRLLLDQWHKHLLQQIRAWIKARKPMARAVSLLSSIVGVGERSAWGLLAILGPDASRFPSANQVAVYVGLDVLTYESGTSVKGAGHISKQGSPRLRRLLGMCAIVAKRWDVDMKQWASELTNRGKKSRVVRVAIMRKLLFLAYGVLKSQQPYDRNRAWPTHQRACAAGTSAA